MTLIGLRPQPSICEKSAIKRALPVSISYWEWRPLPENLGQDEGLKHFLPVLEEGTALLVIAF